MLTPSVRSETRGTFVEGKNVLWKEIDFNEQKNSTKTS